MLLVEQKSYLLYKNAGYPNLGYKILTTTLKNHMQKTLDTIVAKNQSVAAKNRTILHTISTVQDVIDVPYKLNLALIFFIFILHFTE